MGKTSWDFYTQAERAVEAGFGWESGKLLQLLQSQQQGLEGGGGIIVGAAALRDYSMHALFAFLSWVVVLVG